MAQSRTVEAASGGARLDASVVYRRLSSTHLKCIDLSSYICCESKMFQAGAMEQEPFTIMFTVFSARQRQSTRKSRMALDREIVHIVGRRCFVLPWALRPSRQPAEAGPNRKHESTTKINRFGSEC